MTWTERVRRAMLNYKEQMDARPLALPLSMAYNGENPVAFWRMLEAPLAMLLDAGFDRRQAIVLGLTPLRHAGATCLACSAATLREEE